MASGYKIFWTDHALKELADTYKYLEENFSDKEMRSLSSEIQKTLNLISVNPRLFPCSKSNKVRKAVVKKYNSMFYWVKSDEIEILSFFSNRQSPKKGL
ncbi:MAG: type II toxin-antitoxin system RelE/ParE family toxin [Nonlabens sp.]|uniref:type II toxin-antitoxin system RelE/ParE family toxin n=1 Tax=Nonlabens sp. TaxID=1888209 RepID=UPI003EF32CD3